MDEVDAAYEVLKRAKEPLKPNEIIGQAIRLGFIERKSYANIRMASAIGLDSPNRFFSIGKGRYALTEWSKGKRKKVTIADLAFWILRSEKRKLHYTDIAKRINRVRDLGRTPSIAAHVVLSNNKAFKQFGRGEFGLRGWKPQRSAFGEFIRASPSQPWRMPNKLSHFLGSARQIARVCCPYIDKSTFQTFLSHVPKQVETQLIVTKDPQFEDKVRRGLSKDFLQRFGSGRRLITRRVEDLHSRFIVIDDGSICLLSADLQTDQQTRRYQYAFFTNDLKVTRHSISYFQELWKSGVVCDLETEVGALGKP